MDVYNSRFQKEYVDLLDELLKFENQEDIENKTELLSTSKEVNGKTYNRVLKVYFNGISATTLFDKSRNFNRELNKGVIAKKFIDLLKNVEFLNEKGVYIELRLLFVYPFSDFSINLLQAERKISRPVISTEYKFIPSFDIEDSITEEDIIHSSNYIYLNNTLKTIREILIDYPYNKKNISNTDIKYPNTILVKFTPQSPNHCTLIVNDNSFTDYYSYSKREKTENSLPYETPLIHINKKIAKESFECIENHFQYLWQEDTTIFYDDALDIDLKNKNGKLKIKKPSEINFDAKAIWLQNRIKDIDTSEGERRWWQFRVSQKLLSLAKIIESPNQTENLFIASSWEKSLKTDILQPIGIACELKDTLIKQFVSDSNDPKFNVTLFDRTPSSSSKGFPDDIFDKMDESSLAIVILSSSEKSQTPKSNLSIELGYLLKKFGRNHQNRIIIFAEDGMEIPTLINHFRQRHRFQAKNYRYLYTEILIWLIQNSRTITTAQFENSISAYVKYLRKYQNIYQLNSDEINEIEKKLNKTMSK